MILRLITSATSGSFPLKFTIIVLFFLFTLLFKCINNTAIVLIGLITLGRKVVFLVVRILPIDLRHQRIRKLAIIMLHQSKSGCIRPILRFCDE